MLVYGVSQQECQSFFSGKLVVECCWFVCGSMSLSHTSIKKVVTHQDINTYAFHTLHISIFFTFHSSVLSVDPSQEIPVSMLKYVLKWFKQ